MNQDYIFHRRLRMSVSDVVVAWTDPRVMSEWFWPHIDDVSYDLPRHGRGDAYRISSASTGVTISGTCLHWDQHGFDLTWRVDGADFVQEGLDTLSVRLLPIEGKGCELVLTYAVNSNIAPHLTRMWDPTLDRLAALHFTTERVA